MVPTVTQLKYCSPRNVYISLWSNPKQLNMKYWAPSLRPSIHLVGLLIVHARLKSASADWAEAGDGTRTSRVGIWSANLCHSVRVFRTVRVFRKPQIIETLIAVCAHEWRHNNYVFWKEKFHRNTFHIYKVASLFFIFYWFIFHLCTWEFEIRLTTIIWV